MNFTMIVKDLEVYIENIGKHYRVPALEDYRQEVLLILFEKGKDFILELNANNKLKNYVYRICVLLLYSKEGAYYKKYIKPKILGSELKGTEKRESKSFNEERISDLIDSLEGMDKQLLEQLLICRGNKYSFSKKANISYSTINMMLNNLSEKIKKDWDINDFYD
mgnify:CR=1 FL=1|tara:strand:- start:5155 stop:5649 length:495 start_codon:yes stop_codon:yes gene_type:complete